MVAGRTDQEYNVLKNRKGAFREDRYHATAVESNRYLRQCITYIDINMVRAGVVRYPTQSALLVLAGGQIYKTTDWRIIWFNPFIIEPEGDNHPKDNGVGVKFPASD